MLIPGADSTLNAILSAEMKSSAIRRQTCEIILLGLFFIRDPCLKEIVNLFSKLHGIMPEAKN
jgi:hypothetical protein